MEKLEPKKERSPIGSLKFQRKSDYKKFRNFIKKKTKELEGVTEPKDDKLKSILRVGVGGLGLLAIGALFGGKGKGKGDGEGRNFPFAIGRKNPNDPSLPKTPKILPKPIPPKPKFKRPKSTTAELPKRKFTLRKTYSANRKFRGRDVVAEKKKLALNSSILKVNKKKVKSLSDEVKAQNRLIENLTKKSGGKSGKIGIIPDPEGEAMRKQRIKDNLQLEKQQRDAISNQKMKNLVEAESGTKIRDFKPTTPDESKLGEGRTIKKRYRGRVKNRDVVLRSGVRGFSKPDPFNRFGTVSNPIMSQNHFKKGFMGNIFKSKITRDTVMGIPTKGKFLTKAGMFFNHPIPKGISFILTGYEAFQEGKSIVNFKDNLFTRLYDLGVAINNELIHPDDPSKMKLFISESSNDKIRKHDIMRNVKILELRKQQAQGAGGGNNVIVVPENQQNNEVKSNIPIKTGGTEVSFVPLEPLNSVGTDVLLHKLNQ